MNYPLEKAKRERDDLRQQLYNRAISQKEIPSPVKDLIFQYIRSVNKLDIILDEDRNYANIPLENSRTLSQYEQKLRENLENLCHSLDYYQKELSCLKSKINGG